MYIVSHLKMLPWISFPMSEDEVGGGGGSREEGEGGHVFDESDGWM